MQVGSCRKDRSVPLSERFITHFEIAVEFTTGGTIESQYDPDRMKSQGSRMLEGRPDGQRCLGLVRS